jgi:hypothetical protein
VAEGRTTQEGFIRGGIEMPEIQPTEQTRQTAEAYLDEMIDAQRRRDYEAWTRHYEKETLEDFDEADSLRAIDNDLANLGGYIRREYLGVVNGDQGEHQGCLRFVWRGIFEKNEAVIILGIHEKDGRFFVNENMYHY